MTESPKICFIGAGKHARANLYPALRALGWTVSAIATTNEESAQSAADDLGVERAYADAMQMLESEKPDAVVISLPAQKNHAMVVAVVERGIHVFVEKPLGWNADEARQIEKLAREKQVVVMVGFMKRYAPAYMQLRALAQRSDAEIGALAHLDGTFAVRSFGNDPETYLKFGGVHFVDLLLFVLGSVDELVGFRKVSPSGVHFAVSGRGGAGVTFNLTLLGLPSWGRHFEEVTLTTERAFGHVDNMRTYREHIERATQTSTPRWQQLDEVDMVNTFVDTSSSGGMQPLYVGGYVGELEAFRRMVSDGESDPLLLEQNSRVMELCDQILALPEISAR